MSYRYYPNAARALKRVSSTQVTSRSSIPDDAELKTLTIRPWTRAEHRMHYLIVEAGVRMGFRPRELDAQTAPERPVSSSEETTP